MNPMLRCLNDFFGRLVKFFFESSQQTKDFFMHLYTYDHSFYRTIINRKDLCGVWMELFICFNTNVPESLIMSSTSAIMSL
jgi:hypothetical protein